MPERIGTHGPTLPVPRQERGEWILGTKRRDEPEANSILTSSGRCISWETWVTSLQWMSWMTGLKTSWGLCQPLYDSFLPLSIHQESLSYFQGLSAAKSPSSVAFRLWLNCSPTSMQHSWVLASLVPGGSSDDNTSRNGLSAGGWISGIIRAWGYGVPAQKSMAMSKRTM